MEKEKRTLAERYEISFNNAFLAKFGNEDGYWFEGEDEIKTGIAWGEEKARLLKWVRKQMRRRLTPRQRRCIELYYFKDMTYAEIGRKNGCCPSSVCRAVQRGVRRLRAAAELDPPAVLRRRTRASASRPRRR